MFPMPRGAFGAAASVRVPIRRRFSALAGYAVLLLSLVSGGAARSEIRVTDVLGRQVVLAKSAERVMLGFYFEDFFAIAGPGAVDKLRAVSLFYWKGYRPKQYEAYRAALPAIGALADIGDVDNGTMSAEKIVAMKPDVAI